MLEIIKKSELKVVEELNQYLEKGYINIDIIKNNINIYYDKDVFNNLNVNIELLIDKKANLMMIENKDFLLTENSLIIQNINILENIGIDISKLRKFDMLKEINLQEKINSFEYFQGTVLFSLPSDCQIPPMGYPVLRYVRRP